MERNRGRDDDEKERKGSFFPQHLLQLVGWNKSCSKTIMRDIWHSKLVNGNQVLGSVGLRSQRQPTPDTSMQMQSHAQADRCSGFLPNVWAYEIISAFHLLVRMWFIKWPPTTVLIYKANWGVWCAFFFFFSRLSLPKEGCSSAALLHVLTVMDTEKLHQKSWVWSALQVHSHTGCWAYGGWSGERNL